MSTQTRKFQFTVHETNEADIFSALKDVPNESATIKRLLRAGIAAERTMVKPEWKSSVLVSVPPDPRPEPPAPVPAEHAPASSGNDRQAKNGAPPTFVPPPGFLSMTKPEQNRIRAQWFADHEAKKG